MNNVTDAELRFAPPWRWRDGHAQLGREFVRLQYPDTLPAPCWVARSARAARELGLSPEEMEQPGWIDVLAGNGLFADSEPVATVYSGHQFGHWAGQLGDGRAVLLGETEAGLEVQLKGAGQTPYSRMGDGRAVLRSSIREFLASEAMQGLGIPTTRALAVVGSELPVQRETTETAAVVTRVAPSFIRFGHFEHFAALDHVDALRHLADFVIDRHYPGCRAGTADGGNAYAALLAAVAERTAELIAHWQAVGFCHGVMNTDNMSILGLTLDYGPYQFLDGFDPGHICNHSDTQGRYAYGRQPQVAYWNLMCLARALLPLIGEEPPAVAALQRYKTAFAADLPARYLAKLGLQAREEEADDADLALIDTVLALLAAERVDLTIFWRRLSHYVANGQAQPVRDLFIDRAGFDNWLRRYDVRLAREDAAQAAVRMLATNPKFVLRNHLAELAIRRARDGDYGEIARLLTLLETPYDEHPGHEDAADFAPDWAATLEISCSS